MIGRAVVVTLSGFLSSKHVTWDGKISALGVYFIQCSNHLICSINPLSLIFRLYLFGMMIDEIKEENIVNIIYHLEHDSSLMLRTCGNEHDVI